MGGDADTRGAISGALAGAFYGVNAIPDRWKNALVDRHGKPIYEELLSIGKTLYQLSQKCT